MMNQANTIAIIGGFGFIGTNLVKNLVNNHQYQSIYLIGKNKIQRINTKTNEHFECSRTADNLVSVFNKVETIIYLAWSSTPFSSMVSTVTENNVEQLKHYLKLITSSKLDRFIFISSAGALYKSNDHKIFSEETDSSEVLTPYASEKLEAEAIVNQMLDGICSTTILRPSNVYGPGQPFKLGMGLIPKLLLCAYKDEPISLYEALGSERDYLYIDDFILAITHFISEGKISGLFNIASGKNTTLGALIVEIEKLTGTKISHRLNIKIASNHAVISTKKMNRVCNWSSKIDIVSGLSSTIAQYKS